MLVYPNQRWQKQDYTSWNLNPQTLCLLAAMVKDIVDVKIVDAQFYNLGVEEFISELKAFSPDYIGISSLTSEYGEILDITAETVKKVNPGIITIAGGIHPTIEYKEIIKNKNIDYIVRGEGEYVLKQLLLFLQGKGDLPEEGLVYRDGKEIIVQKKNLVKDLTQLPWPDYSYINLEDYIYVGPRTGPLRAPEFPYMRLMVTRGCPVGCSFCQVKSISGAKIRARDPKDIVEELKYYKKTYGIKSLIFDDDNMMSNKPFFISFLKEMIKGNLGLKYIIESFAIFSLTDEMLDLLEKSGCIGVNIAIESGNHRVLKDIVKKPVDLTSVPQRIEQFRKKGMFVIANFIVGFPGEKWEEIRETIHFAEHCKADYVKIFVAVPLKGTKLWDIAVQMNVLKHDETDIKVDWRNSQIISDEWTSKDVSILRAYEWDRINFATPEKRKYMSKLWGVPEEELMHIRKKTRDAVAIGSGYEN